MSKVIEFANNGGFVLGICNGFQILCEANLLPGTLTRNENHNFICKNTFIKPQHNLTILTEKLPKEVLKIPIAHAEGRYYADEKTLQEIINNKQITFKYCDERGEISKRINPNGSLKNIAGICNKKRNGLEKVQYNCSGRQNILKLLNIKLHKYTKGLIICDK